MASGPHTVSAEILRRFLEEKGFTRYTGDPFYSTYQRGKLIYAFDPERPDIPLFSVAEDLRAQKYVNEHTMIEHLIEQLIEYVRIHEEGGHEEQQS